MRYDDILTYFKVQSRSGDKAQCKCPCHDDKQASLTISQGQKGVVLHCHAGCDTASILGQVGLNMKDLFDAPAADDSRWKKYVEGRKHKSIEAVYHYKTLSGSYAYTKIRLQGKDLTYGILKDDRFSFGLAGKSRASFHAIYTHSNLEKADTVYYVEGEKDVDSLSRIGLASFTAGGVGDWQQELSSIFKDKRAVILADNDAPGLKLANKVRDDVKGFASAVCIVVTTPEIDKGDVSDYLKDHSKEDLLSLVENEFKNSEIMKSENNISEDMKSENMNSIDLCQFHIISEKTGNVTGVFDYRVFEYICKNNNIFIIGGTPWIYRDGVYIEDRTGSLLKTMIRELIFPEFIKSTTIKRVYELFILAEELQKDFSEINCYPEYWINFKNGFYDPKTRQMIDHDPKYYAINQVPWSFNPAAGSDGQAVEDWLSFIFDNEDDRKMILQFAGLCLCRDVSQQKFMILCGEGGTGKSTLIRLIECMIGADNISNISLTELQHRFSSYGLMGKLVNSCADLEISALEDTSTLKKSLGEDTLRGEQKGKDAFSFKSYAKMIFSTNELPVIKSERTNGFYRRLLIFPMNKIPERKRADLFTVLSSQIDYFIGLCVDALSDLYASGHIVESAASIHAVNQLKYDSDTVEAWMSEETTIDRGSRTDRTSLFNSYDRYCNDNDRQALSRNNFYKALRSKGFPEISSCGSRFIKGILLGQNCSKTALKSALSDDDFVEVYDQTELPF